MESSSIQTYHSPIHGTGLVASEFIPAGTVISKASPDDIKLTYKELMRLPKEQHHLPSRYRDGFILAVDGSQYMNHSCDPNTWWLDDETMTARCDIQPGQEITYDYASSDVHPWWRPKWKCRCKAERCRGIITGRDCLAPAFQERYQGHLPSWVLAFIEEQSGLRGWVTGWFAKLVEMVRRLKVAFRADTGG